MRKIIVTSWLSLDGVFDATTMNEWFNPYHSESRAKSIQATIDDCEVMLYGKNTYLMLAPYWSSFKNNEMGVAEKLNKVEKIVVSTSLKEPAWENTRIVSNNVKANLENLKAAGTGNILVQGSATLVSSLFEWRLVDEFNFLIQPHIVGKQEGRFFSGINGALELTGVEKLERGVLQIKYRPLDDKN